MRIVIATPLYPPDRGGASLYVKELAERLRKEHTVRVLLYGHLPEQIEGVQTIAVSKRHLLPIRLSAFFFTLVKEMKGADVLIAENGPSIELPVLLLSLISRKPIIFHIGDKEAHEHAQKGSGFRKKIQKRAFSRASTVLPQTPLSRPEILPFRPRPAEELLEYEQSWETHITRFSHLLSYGS